SARTCLRQTPTGAPAFPAESPSRTDYRRSEVNRLARLCVQEANRLLSIFLPCSPPLRLAFCARLKNSARSLSPSHTASWTYPSSRRALIKALLGEPDQ